MTIPIDEFYNFHDAISSEGTLRDVHSRNRRTLNENDFPERDLKGNDDDVDPDYTAFELIGYDLRTFAVHLEIFI